MNQSRYANTSILSNRNNQTNVTGTNDRMIKLSEKLNKISVSFHSFLRVSLKMKNRQNMTSTKTR